MTIVVYLNFFKLKNSWFTILFPVCSKVIQLYISFFSRLFSIIRSVQLLSRVRLFVTPWIAARQASLSITNSRSSLRLKSIESVMPKILNIVPCAIQFSSVTQSCPTLCDPHGLQHASLTCPSPTPGACPNSCASSWWCHPAISSSVEYNISLLLIYI